jgi:NADH:ubiquinone oxidoreductase subunit E
MIHVEYSFCRMRLPATGFTLPWQLVDAQDPGPMYLLESFCAKSTAGIVSNDTQTIMRWMEVLEAWLIQRAGESVCLYRLRRREVNGPRCLFRGAARKANGALFTAPFPASSMQEIQHSLRARRGAVIFDDLRAIQLRHGFLPKAELEDLSKRGQIPLYQIHSVASFYPHFHLVPPPKAEIRVCADMSCHLNGASELRTDLERRFANARPEDIQIRDVSCLGRCDHAPAASINDHIFTGVTAALAEQMARSAMRGEEILESHPQAARVECKADPYGNAEKYGVVRKLVQSRTFDDVFERIAYGDAKPLLKDAQRSLLIRRIVGDASLNGLGRSARFAGFADSLGRGRLGWALEAGELKAAPLSRAPSKEVPAAPRALCSPHKRVDCPRCVS